MCFTRRFIAFIVRNDLLILRVAALQDGGRPPRRKDRNADILVSSELVGRGSWLWRGARDPAEGPIGFLVVALEARVTAALTNPRRRFAHVDVMQYDEEEGGGVLYKIIWRNR